MVGAWGTALVATRVKAVMRRPRPVAGVDLRVVVAPLGGSSFPSGHTITYVGVYGFLAYLAHTLLRPARLRRAIVAALVGLVGLVGPSRIQQGHHWFTDVTASYLLGLAISRAQRGCTAGQGCPGRDAGMSGARFGHDGQRGRRTGVARGIGSSTTRRPARKRGVADQRLRARGRCRSPRRHGLGDDIVEPETRRRRATRSGRGCTTASTSSSRPAGTARSASSPRSCWAPTRPSPCCRCGQRDEHRPGPRHPTRPRGGGRPSCGGASRPSMSARPDRRWTASRPSSRPARSG